jgi:hypothetical protein
MRGVGQGDIEKILRAGGAVPDEQIFGDSTRNTARAQLSRVKKKIEMEGDYTVTRLQCYRLEPCKLPAGLKKSFPVLYEFANTLNGSTALSMDQIARRVWQCGDRGGGDGDVWDGVCRLRRDWELDIISTGFHQLVVKVSDHVVPAVIEQPVVNAPSGPRKITLPSLSCLSEPFTDDLFPSSSSRFPPKKAGS